MNKIRAFFTLGRFLCRFGWHAWVNIHAYKGQRPVAVCADCDKRIER